MGTTTRGVPYPEPTDPIAQGADAIRKAVQTLDGRMIQSGVATFTTAGGTGGVQTVTFPVPYTAAPVVVVSMQGGSGFMWTVQITSRSSTSFTLLVWRNGAAVPDSQTLNVQWVAIGPTTAAT